MKNTTIILALTMATPVIAQTFTADFESFTLPVNSHYEDTNSVPFASGHASFMYKWDKAFDYWSGGFSYTNHYDSITAGYMNMYGVRPLKGRNNSGKYVIGQDRGVIKLLTPAGTVDGFYITNTTYAYKSMKFGDGFAKKFGGTSGNDPDFFKIVLKGYLNGAVKTDSVEFFLADFRNSNNSLDYVVDTWQYVNAATIGKVDSVKFFMRSSDVGASGINTPLFFGLDDFTISYPNITSLEDQTINQLSVYPNPFENKLTTAGGLNSTADVLVTDLTGKVVLTGKCNEELNTVTLQAGIYILSIGEGDQRVTRKIVKQ